MSFSNDHWTPILFDALRPLVQWSDSCPDLVFIPSVVFPASQRPILTPELLVTMVAMLRAP
ncbi:hypothetical protein, partial [Klebsiella pneumoniae]|uniref:hypothetical protein n=1 Tax=Klebsiella pneumoniae TaxID=573 RepID=UPI0040556324